MASSSQGSTGSRLVKPISQSQRTVVDVKGKNKETKTPVDDEDDSLWVDKYEPTSEVRRTLSLLSPITSACPLLKLEHQKAELAVHKRKVEDVRRWLLEAFEGGPSAKLRKYRVRVCTLAGH